MAPDVDVCSKCKDNFIVNSRSVKCGICMKKFHTGCASIKDSWAKMISECENILWLCVNCKKSFKVRTSGEEMEVAILQKEIECLNREKELTNKLVSELVYINEFHKSILKPTFPLSNFASKSSCNTDCCDNNAATPSYSDIAKSMSHNRTAKDTATLIVKSSDEAATSNDILTDIKKSIRPADLNICVNTLREIKNGVAIHCENDTSRTILKNELSQTIGNKYDISEANKLNPRLLVKNVNLEGLDTCEAILHNIVSLNNLKESSSQIKIVTKLKYFQDINLVIEVSPDVRTIILQKGYLFIGWKKSSVSDHIRIIRCSKCCGYGHTGTECKSEVTCFKCGGKHKAASCTSSILRCINCSNNNQHWKRKVQTDHASNDKQCPTFKNYINNLNSKINYG